MQTSIELLRTKLEDYLTRRLAGPASIRRLRSLSGGACQDNYLVDLSVGAGEYSGDHELVMRTDKGASLLRSLSRVDEFLVARAAYTAGVKTPRPLWLEKNTEIIGSPFCFMERIPGSAGARYLLRDKELGEYRRSLPGDIAANLARIHGVTPESIDDPELAARLKAWDFDSPKDAARSSIATIRGGLDELPGRYPAIELCLNWLEANAPATDRPVLVHGDFRTGNFMVSPAGLHGILDWEFAHWGDRHEDIGWLCMRDWRFGKNNLPVGGFAGREDFYRAYEEAAGVRVDERKVLFWEIAGNVGWALGAAQQAERHLSGADRGIEYASIGRRVCEMEYEMMRLIENAG